MNHQSQNTFNGLQNDPEVESRARAIFKAACANTDSYHLLRLGLARRKALNAAASHSAVRAWVPVAGAAIACCALVVAVTTLRPIARTAPPARVVSSAPLATAEPMEMLDEAPEVGTSQMEMVQNLDFYRWLATQPGAPTSGSRGSR